MNETRFGDYLSHLLREQGLTGVDLATGIGFSSSATVNRWINNKQVPKLNSRHVRQIGKFLGLNESEQGQLEKAQIYSLLSERASSASAAVKGFLQEAQFKGSHAVSQQPVLSVAPPKSRAIRGRKEIAQMAASLLANVPKVTGEPRPEILISAQGMERPEFPAESTRPLVRGIKRALEEGWAVRSLWRLDENIPRTVGLVKDMLEPTGTGHHFPEYFASYGTLSPPYDLLVIPDIAALACFASGNTQWVDSALVVTDTEEIRLLADHFAQLRTKTRPLLTSYLPQRQIDYWDALEAAERQSVNRGLVNDGVSTLARPIEWYRNDSFVAESLREQEADPQRLVAYERTRIEAFTTALADPSTSYRDICPKRAIERFVKDGYSRGDLAARTNYWTPPEKRSELLLRLIFLLERHHPKYQLALLEDIEEKRIATTLSWEVTSRGVFVEAWTPDTERGQETEIAVQIEEPTVVRAFWEHFDDLWKSISPASKNKTRLIEWLQGQIAHIPNSY